MILPGNKLIIATSTISALSNVELVQLLAHSLAHMLFQHRREVQSLPHLINPFLFTIIFLNFELWIAQCAVVWFGTKLYGRSLERVFEAEANRMARKLSEKAGLGDLAADDEGRWGCGGKVRF